MSAIPSTPLAATGVAVGSLTSAQRYLVLSVTVLLALAIYYFVGFDQGMSSVFGNSMVIHEFGHDARHFLGFPCH